MYFLITIRKYDLLIKRSNKQVILFWVSLCYGLLPKKQIF